MPRQRLTPAASNSDRSGAGAAPPRASRSGRAKLCWTKKRPKLGALGLTYFARSALAPLELPDDDRLELRECLKQRIGEIIAARRLTQAQAGEIMGMDGGRVSTLVSGRAGGFSSDCLLKALSDLGQNVELRISPARRGKGWLRLAG